MNQTIENEVKSFLDKNLSERHHNTIYTTLSLAAVFLVAAWGGHSITDVADAPSTDTVFYWMETTLEKLDKEFRQFVEKILHKNSGYFRRHTPYLLIDETYESYTGKLLKKRWKTKKEKEICKFIHSFRPKNGDTGAFKFLTFALVGHIQKLIVRAMQIKADDGLKYSDGKRHEESEIPHIMETIKWLRNHIRFRLVIMDRGFYNEELIRLLNKENIPYLIRAKISAAIKSMIAGLTTKWAAIEYHVDETASKKGEKTILVIGKDKSGEWAFVTNRLPAQAWRLRHYYRKRWNIENIFQVCDGISLHTNSTEIEKKLFCFIVSCMVYNLWQFSHEKVKGMTLRRFTKKIIKRIEEVLDKGPPKDKNLGDVRTAMM